jgi:putative transposase
VPIGCGARVVGFVQFYHLRSDWYVPIFLLMPDHFHALIAPAPDKDFSKLIGDWKRFVTSRHKIRWQKNFFDHRLRSDESWEEKAEYIRMNPVRAGLMTEGEAWPYVIVN